MNKKISTFRALRSRNFALYFTGQSISQIGTWMQNTGVSWVIYSMTHSTFMLGLAVFSLLFPRFVLSLFGGIVSDRYNRYKILLITQIASMIQAALLATLTLSNHYTVWELLALSAMLGVINAFDSPARQPLVHELVFDKDDLPNAVALNSSMVNFAKIVGPAISGIILVKFGAGICFLINAISFMAVIISLLFMKLPPNNDIRPVKKKITTELTDGFKYIRRTPDLGLILLMVSVVSLLVLPYETLMPVFAKVVFKGDASTFGYIRSFIGIGAIVGTVFLASLKPGADLKFVLLTNTIILGIGLIFFSLVTNFQIAMAFAIIFGFGAMAQTTVCLTILQIQTEEKMRGRVMSYLLIAMTGTLPIGGLIVGAISQHIGAPYTLCGQGFLALIIAASFAKFLGRDRLYKNKLESFEEAEIDR
ncbi:MAG: MFS transporter [Bacteroidales bacterium]